MSVGAIPSSEVKAWLDLRGIKDPSVCQDFAAVVRLVDRAFLSQREEWTSDEDETEESQEPGNDPGKAPKRRTRKGKK